LAFGPGIVGLRKMDDLLGVPLGWRVSAARSGSGPHCRMWGAAFVCLGSHPVSDGLYHRGLVSNPIRCIKSVHSGWAWA